MANSTLNAIRLKVRRLTRSPSANQLSDATLDEYVNTFIQYDFPEHLRTFKLVDNLTFYTQPNVDIYQTNQIANSPLQNFENINITVHPPVYIAGFESFFTQSQDEFYRIYPKLSSIASTGLAGDGVTVTFAGTLSAVPIMQNQVLFNSIDANNNGLVLVDVPFNNETGNLVVPNNAPPAFLNPLNFINYLTGQFVVTFNTAPAAGQAINSETVAYQPAQPRAMLFFQNKFYLRPIPDQVYGVTIQVQRRPLELLVAGQSPELEQWWQYIAYGASKKIFEDRMDLESVQLIMPEFKTQERLVLRTTLVQQKNERVATIYTDMTAGAYGAGWWYGGSNL